MRACLGKLEFLCFKDSNSPPVCLSLIEIKPVKQKLFSIITPVYNGGLKIEKTIHSVLSQDESLFEYIIVDGGSTDETLDIAEQYEDKIEIISEPDEGVYDAMNKGIDVATGKYLYFLGAGDSLRSNILSSLAGGMPEGELWFVYGNVYMLERGIIYDGEFNKAKLRKYNICHQAVFYERRIFDVVSQFETEYTVLADYVMNIKCFWNDRVQKKYVGYLIANFEGGGISTTQKDSKFIEQYSDLIMT